MRDIIINFEMFLLPNACPTNNNARFRCFKKLLIGSIYTMQALVDIIIIDDHITGRPTMRSAFKRLNYLFVVVIERGEHVLTIHSLINALERITKNSTELG